MSIQSEVDTFLDRDQTGAPSSGSRLTAHSISLEYRKDSRLVFVTDPNGLGVERYRLLRRRLCASSPTGGMLMITSPSSGDGKTLTAVNLAWCLAESGQQTCLVDLDFRAPGVGRTLGYEKWTSDVVGVLAGQCTVSQALHQIENHRLHVLGIRHAILSPSHQLSPAVLKPMLKELRDRFEWVILDMPPTIPMADVAEVLPHVDGALMIVRSAKTTKSIVGPTLEILGTKLWGVVLNDATINGSAYYGNYGYGANRNRKQ
ncbi:tyrosine-protein kinase family protein [Acidicapsa ligni]|uniref:tyrosine-protein kinase family protein n=1 Tax=Acidicapsa ligni TaxID=542300 RepID=UPI0021E0929A|nr:CpsD/CapB family tyrosine-protein kinase [Acidicapsa ligni]